MKIIEVKYLSPLEENNPENDNIDVLMTLDDGRVYSFVIATPNNIYWCMENEGIDYFFGIPPVLVKSITRENIERALEALITENDGKWLDVYGTLQH
ncbi:MAG TPA: hypothetical protein VNN73_23085 [Blastocatellia bacterium]|nr:hypothetical protein [Blastocatellia bacterium]